MAGNGPAPKPAERSVRRKDHQDRHPTTVLRSDRASQPKLPGDKSDWPKRTRDWWRMWGRSPQAEHFSSSDWDFLLDTAYLHAAFVAGDLKQAGELRLRVAKFGATPEDRARLRMQFAEADKADGGEQRPASSAGDRYGDLRVVRGGSGAVAGS